MLAVRAAWLARQILDDAGLVGAVKTSGSKGVHIVVPIDRRASGEDVAAATRALAARAERLDPDLATTEFIREDRGGRVFLDSTRAGGATVVAAYSPRVRPGVPVSFPVVAWFVRVQRLLYQRLSAAVCGAAAMWLLLRSPPVLLPVYPQAALL